MDFTTPRIVEQYAYITLLKDEKMITKKAFNDEKKKLVAEKKIK